jgi:hypothetical protein
MAEGKFWIGVDLDSTLAYYDGWRGPDHIGAPIPVMVERVKHWLAEGVDVRIFTARVWCDPAQFDWAGERGRTQESYDAQQLIEAWCVEHIGQILPITCMKDFGMIELWDDRCVRVIPNEGNPCCPVERKYISSTTEDSVCRLCEGKGEINIWLPDSGCPSVIKCSKCTGTGKLRDV